MSNRRPSRATLAATVALLAGLSTTTAAQDNSLRSGAWALQFGISNNLTLMSFDQAGVALKWHFMPGGALRGGISLVRSSTELKAVPDTLGRNELDSHVLQLALQYVWYPRPDADVNVFVGAGPLYRVMSSEVRSISANGMVTTAEQDSWSAGGGVLLGVEWFAFRSLGIHAEYGLNGLYTSREITNTSPGSPSSATERNDWSIAFNNVLFGLSVYF